MRVEDVLTGTACVGLWVVAGVIMATTPTVVKSVDGACIKVIPASAGSCDALPRRYETYLVGEK